jgi:hypothetical protein
MNSIDKPLLFFALIGLTSAQAPTGTIAGVARDAFGAAVAGAHVKLNSQAVGLGRTAVTSEQGDYAFPVLPVGEYEVSVDRYSFTVISADKVIAINADKQRSRTNVRKFTFYQRQSPLRHLAGLWGIPILKVRME